MRLFYNQWNVFVVTLNLMNSTCVRGGSELCACTPGSVKMQIWILGSLCVIVQYAASFRQYKGLWLGVCDVWCNHAVWSAGTPLASSIASCQDSSRGWGPAMVLEETDVQSPSLTLKRFMLNYIKFQIISNFYLLSVCKHTCTFSWWKIPITKHLWPQGAVDQRSEVKLVSQKPSESYQKILDPF